MQLFSCLFKREMAGGRQRRSANRVAPQKVEKKQGEHDIGFKVKQARTFLEDGDKVKVNVLFRGRENAHHDKGREILTQVISALEDISKVEAMPRMDSGRSMSCVLTPK